jgi:hypothetical protein
LHRPEIAAVSTDASLSPPTSEIRPVDRPENELSSYRAVYAPAIVSLVLGLLAALSFASSYFWIAAVLAIVFGFLALRGIARQPEALTGVKLAKAGIVLGLIFGLSSATWAVVDAQLLQLRAGAFVKQNLLKVLRERDLNAALWYKQDPVSRRGQTPEDIRKMIERQGGSDTIMFEFQAGTIARLNKQLAAEPNAELEFVKVEKSGIEGATPVALALVRVKWPPESEHEFEAGSPEAKAHEALMRDRGDFLGVLLKKKLEGRRESWWVEEYRYPYTPDSFVSEVKPVDDGHGHGGHGH